ncbi:hypothetical protein Nepgr_004734 [Nepenthes gracilis]|uniref:Uncharacterized protein n=1 Tax=Nepenthes gracilis TaxID=150966 RepID=A0AAD3XFL8_NEPGR|nr:hypothetical protein Nepgr_004734 [Nepenthes gracilis]
MTGILPESSRKNDTVIRPQKLSEFNPNSVEDITPAALILGTRHILCILVHFQICGKTRVSGKDPVPAPIPPFSDGASSVVAHGGEGFGSREYPWSGRGRDGLDLQGERRESSA